MRTCDCRGTRGAPLDAFRKRTASAANNHAGSSQTLAAPCKVGPLSSRLTPPPSQDGDCLQEPSGCCHSIIGAFLKFFKPATGPVVKEGRGRVARSVFGALPHDSLTHCNHAAVAVCAAAAASCRRGQKGAAPACRLARAPGPMARIETRRAVRCKEVPHRSGDAGGLQPRGRGWRRRRRRRPGSTARPAARPAPSPGRPAAAPAVQVAIPLPKQQHPPAAVAAALAAAAAAGGGASRAVQPRQLSHGGRGPSPAAGRRPRHAAHLPAGAAGGGVGGGDPAALGSGAAAAGQEEEGLLPSRPLEGKLARCSHLSITL